MDEIRHIVDFARYCRTCAHENKKENESPCDECLEVSARENSRKPERWVKASEKRQ